MERREAVRDVLSGSQAMAHGVRLCKPNVIAAYPITPSTPVVEYLAEFVHNGELEARFIPVESEHSAMSACIAASATGARVFTATASQGLALMHEMLFIASGMRLPIVLGVGNRALSAPINIWCDHSDSMAERDSGWIQIYAENPQEVLDSVIQAYRIAEDQKVMLPAMICMDGFILTHLYEPVEIPAQRDVDDFLPPYDPPVKLDPSDPVTMGPLGTPEHFMETKYLQEVAMKEARRVMERTFDEYEERFGRRYGFIEEFMMDGARVGIVVLGSTAGTIKHFLREKGEKGVGLVRLRVYRPFPKEDLMKALSGLDLVVVLERAFSYGLGYGPVFPEVVSALRKSRELPEFVNVIYGLGGRDFSLRSMEKLYEMIGRFLKEGVEEDVIWLDLRGDLVG